MKTKFRPLLYTVVIVLFTLINYAQQTAQVSILFKVYDDAGGAKDLYFGLDQTATDGIDEHLGESDLPPYPPSGAFDVRWLLPQNNFNGSLSSWKDYRYISEFPYSGSKEYRVRYQCMAGATKITFSWEFPPEVTGVLQDIINGSYVNLSISGTGSYELNNFNSVDRLKLIINYNNVISNIEEMNVNLFTYKLEQNYPNPFNPSTSIQYTIGSTQYVTLKVFDVLGSEVATIVDEYKEPGIYNVQFSVGQDSSPDIASGIYFYSLKAGNFMQTRKMLLLE